MISSFIKVFSREGLDGASIKKLAKEANITESLIYRYFDDKDNVILQCVAYYHELIQSELIDVFKESISDPQNMAEHILEYLDTVLDTCRFLLQVMAHPHYYKTMDKSAVQVEDFIITFSEILVELTSVNETTAKGISFLLNSTVNDYILKRSRENFKIQIDTLIGAIF